jgi:peptidoglycan/LPS O-acetylase OafA/YrhL
MYRRPWTVLATACAVCLVFLLSRTRFPVLSHIDAAMRDHLRLCLYFLVGMVVYFYRDRIKFGPAGLLVSLLVLVTSSLLGSINMLAVVPWAYIVMYAAFLNTPKLHRFARWGDVSYGLYLYAWPIQQLLVQHFGSALNPYTLFLAAFPLTFAAACASWFLVEKPFQRLKSMTANRELLKATPPAEPAGPVAVKG